MGNITKLGIGTIGLGGTYGKVNLTEYSFAIRYALDSGISLVDTSSSYGDGEKLLGIILKDYPYVKISTRLEASRFADQKDLKLAIKKCCEASLNNLGKECIDFYHFQGDYLNKTLDEIIEGLELIKKEGKIKSYGISDVEGKTIQEFISLGKPESILFEYSAIQRQNAERIFGLCKERELLKIAYGIVGRGYLSSGFKEAAYLDEGDIRRELTLFNDYHKQRNKEVLQAISAIAKQRGLASAQVAIAWVLSDPRLDYGIMSTSRYLHVIENIQGAKLELLEDELEYLDTTTFYAEKKLMENELGKMKENLSEEITSPNQGRKRLLEALNIAISRQIVEEEKLLPTVFDLYKFEEARHTTKYLNLIREELKEVIQA